MKPEISPIDIARWVGVGILLFSVGACKSNPSPQTTSSNRSPENCATACRVCNASEKDLRAEFGDTAVPAKFVWAMPFVDGAGFGAYQECVKAAASAGKTAKDLKCSERALKACTQACQGGTDRMAYNKCSNAYLIEAARKVGVPTDRKPTPEEMKKVKAEIENKCGVPR